MLGTHGAGTPDSSAHGERNTPGSRADREFRRRRKRAAAMRKAISAPCLLALGQRGLHQVRTGEDERLPGCSFACLEAACRGAYAPCLNGSCLSSSVICSSTGGCAWEAGAFHVHAVASASLASCAAVADGHACAAHRASRTLIAPAGSAAVPRATPRCRCTPSACAAGTAARRSARTRCSGRWQSCRAHRWRRQRSWCWSPVSLAAWLLPSALRRVRLAPTCAPVPTASHLPCAC